MMNLDTVRAAQRKLRLSYQKYVLPAAAFAAALSIVAYVPLARMFPEPQVRWLYILGLFCSGLAALGLLFEKKCFPLRILTFYLAWLLLSRCLLGKAPFYYSPTFRLALMECAFFIGGACLPQKQRDALWKLVALELAAIMTVWALPGVVTAFTGHSLPGVEKIYLQTDKYVPSLVSLSFFHLHRNVSSMYFVCAAGMLLAACARGGKWVRRLALLLLPLWYLTVALQHSRGGCLAFSVLITLSLAAFLLKKRKLSGTLPGKAALACVLALCLVLSYKSFNVCSELFVSLSRQFREPVASAAAETAEGTALSDGSDGQSALVIADDRSTLRDARTLTGRTGIWKAGLTAIRKDPRIALIGQEEETAMLAVNAELRSYAEHMHNVLMEQLIVAGVPGMLLCAVFLLYLLWQGARCFLRPPAERSLAPLILAAFLAALTVHGMLEPLLSRFSPLPSVLLCLTAGNLTSELSEEKTGGPPAIK